MRGGEIGEGVGGGEEPSRTRTRGGGVRDLSGELAGVMCAFVKCERV